MLRFGTLMTVTDSYQKTERLQDWEVKSGAPFVYIKNLTVNSKIRGTPQILETNVT